MERGLYRITQEALTNVARHARATEVTIVVTLHNNQLTTMIKDNGCGFKTFSNEAGARRHLGLQGMRERSSMMGGQLKAESTIGKGTCITVTVPLHPTNGRSGADALPDGNPEKARV